MATRWKYLTILSDGKTYLAEGPDGLDDSFNDWAAASEKKIADVLNWAGERGWELVGVDSDAGATMSFFKQPA